MKHWHTHLLTVPLLVGSLMQTAAADTIIHAGRLIDGLGKSVRTECSVILHAGRIVRVEDGYTAPADDDRLISLKQHTVMPGLMDMHTHLMSQHSARSYSEKFFMIKLAIFMAKTIHMVSMIVNSIV